MKKLILKVAEFNPDNSLFAKGGLLEPKDAWDKLTIPEKADIIKVGVKHGILDLQELRKKYNEFKEGGSKEEEEEVNTIIPYTQRTEVVITPDTEYNQYLNTLPDNQRFTPNDKYDSYFYWKLNGKPKNFEEAYAKGMFNYDHSDNGYHANSIAFDDNTGIGYFMKPKDHDTVGFELDWFNKGLVTEEGGKQRPVTPEEAIELNEFRRNYTLTDDPDRPNFFMYQPIERANGGSAYDLDSISSGYNKFAGGGAMASDASSGTLNEIPDDYIPLVSNKYQPIADMLKSSNTGFNVDDYTYRVKKLHPEVTREQVQSLYNSTPYIGSDKVYRTQEGGFRAGDETGYGRRVTLYPNAYTKNTGTKVTTSNANDTMGSTFAHETNHLYTDVLLGGSNDTEKDLLFDAYRPGFVIQDPKFNGDFSEERAINAQIRNRISRENGNVIGADLDKAIDNTPDDVLMEMLFDPNNGYINQSGKKHMQDKNGNWNRTDAIRKALKDVAFNSYDNLRDSNIAALGGPLVEAAMNEYRNARHWKHGLGGNLFSGEEGSQQMITTGGAGYAPPTLSSDFLYNTILNLSSNIMTGIHNWGDDGYTPTSGNRPEEQNGGIAQRTFLAGRKIQEEEFKKYGFIKDTSGDYGLVKKEVGNNKYPIWQRTPDEISRDKLIAIGNTYDGFTGIPRNKAIIHGGSYPTAYYVDPSTVGFDFESEKEKTPKFYAKSWDLNDYGGEGGSTAGIFGKALDFIGSPVVQTTGYIDITDSRLKKVDNMLEDYLYEKGLVKHRLDVNNPYGPYFYGLPEITIRGKKRKAFGGNMFAHGGEIGNYYDGWGDAWNYLEKGVQKARQKVKDWGLNKSPAQRLQEVITPTADKKYRQNLYNIVDPTSDVPSGRDIAKYGLVAFAAKYGGDYPYQRTKIDSVADAAWAKRLGLDYNQSALIDNGDGTVRLPSEIEVEIPTDTTALKNRIASNEKRLKQVYGGENTLTRAAINIDKQALEALRKTYRTGEPVMMDEHSHVSRNWQGLTPESDIVTPLNTLHRYTIQYDKDSNRMKYWDWYDFNEFEDFVPGNPYKIQGSINLNKKK